MNGQLIDHEADDTAPNFFEKAIPIVLYDKVIPFDRSGFVVSVSIKEVGKRTPCDYRKPVVASFLSQAAFLTNGGRNRAAAQHADFKTDVIGRFGSRDCYATLLVNGRPDDRPTIVYQRPFISIQ